MSGEKYKTITEAEYNRLRREAMAATDERERRLALERLNDRLKRSAELAESRNRAMTTKITSLEDKIKAAGKDASDLKKQLYDTVTKTNKELADQRIRFEKDLVKTRSDFADAMDRNNRRIEDVINKTAAGLKADIDNVKKEAAADVMKLKAKIAALAEKVGDPQKVIAMADDYLDVAVELLKECDNFRHGLLLPGRYQEVQALLEKARVTLTMSANNPAAASAALVQCQDAFDGAKAFYDDLLAAENEWAAKQAYALNALASAEARINANKKLIYFDEEKDVNHWSNGGLQKLKDLADKLRDQLENPATANTLTCKDLEDIAASAQLINDDADNVLVGAQLALDCSDARVELAADLAKELYKQAGMEDIRAHGYEGNDQRAANMIHLKNATTGFEVVITLTPVFENGQIGWRADTVIVNPGRNTAAAAAFENVLRTVMHRHGLNGNAPIPVDAKAGDAVTDWKERQNIKVPAIDTPCVEKLLIN